MKVTLSLNLDAMLSNFLHLENMLTLCSPIELCSSAVAHLHVVLLFVFLCAINCTAANI